jgi:type IV secretion system protein VirB9
MTAFPAFFLPLLLAAPAASTGSAPAHARIEAANRAASREPRRDGFVNARQVYSWSDGALYQIYTAPGHVTDIALQAGEQLMSVAAGDTARWVIGDTSSGSGPARRTHLLVKPMSEGLSTNLVVATDRRTYHLSLSSSSAAGAMAAVAWAYPLDGLLALRRSADADAAAAPASPEILIEKLNFAYAIDGDRPSWRPVRAFDDGRQVYLQFPPGLAQGEAPPLFLLGVKGEAQLVNYRVRGIYYIVDRLFDRAELRLGGKHQQVVRITRIDAGGGKRRS